MSAQNQNQIHSIAITNDTNYLYEYSICTLVTRHHEYQQMMQSFVDKGFTSDKCEFLHIDNSVTTTFEAFEGYNIFLQKAKGRYIILCHQDLLIHDSNYSDLQQTINQISIKDQKWAVLGNAGGLNLKWIGTHITEGKTGVVRTEPNLPLKAITLDENFIIVKASANLALSNDLSGFHFYGTDLCLIANLLGFTSYIINFNLIHNSNGKKDDNFYEIERRIKYKYKEAYRPRYITTTFSRFYLSGNQIGFYFFNTAMMLFFARQYFKFFTTKSKFWLK